MEKDLLTTPQEEAISLLSESISGLTSPNKDIKSILRKCQLACELLGWDQQKSWFHQELNGYYEGASLPSYRKISGLRKWEISGSDYEKVKWAAEVSAYGVDPKIYDEEKDTLEVWTGIDWFLTASQTGWREFLQDTKQAHSPSGKSSITLQRVRVFSPPAIAASLLQIEKSVYDFVANAYANVKYGNVIRDIWDDYRIKVDKALSKLELTQHLSVIETNVISTNPEAGRLAVLACRNLLNDLANYLWQDTRERYEHLPGKTEDGKLDVSQGKFNNRLAAYLHQKGITGTQGKFLRDESMRLSTSIRSLIAYQSEAHEPISPQNVKSIAVATYIIIGEIVTRTDLIPIEKYETPFITKASAS